MRSFERSNARSPKAASNSTRCSNRRRTRDGDWPDLLAQELASQRVASLADWSDAHGLHTTSVSRGFRLAYGVSPKRFRLEQMAARAARRIRDTAEGLGQIAAGCGFADQAHMTRTIGRLFAVSPLELRHLS